MDTGQHRGNVATVVMRSLLALLERGVLLLVYYHQAELAPWQENRRTHTDYSYRPGSVAHGSQHFSLLFLACGGSVEQQAPPKPTAKVVSKAEAEIGLRLEDQNVAARSEGTAYFVQIIRNAIRPAQQYRLLPEVYSLLKGLRSWHGDKFRQVLPGQRQLLGNTITLLLKTLGNIRAVFTGQRSFLSRQTRLQHGYSRFKRKAALFLALSGTRPELGGNLFQSKFTYRISRFVDFSEGAHIIGRDKVPEFQLGGGYISQAGIGQINRIDSSNIRLAAHSKDYSDIGFTGKSHGYSLPYMQLLRSAVPRGKVELKRQTYLYVTARRHIEQR